MPYCRDCGSELSPSQTYCKQCGTRASGEAETQDRDESVDALSAVESTTALYRYYTHPPHRKWLTLHLLLAFATGGAWLLYLLYVWFSIWDGTTSKDLTPFVE